MINLTQWLCPQRHCIIAFVWDPERETEEQNLERGERLFKTKAVQRACAICGGEIHTETAPTKFETIREAMPTLRVLQEANIQAMRILQRKN